MAPSQGGVEGPGKMTMRALSGRQLAVVLLPLMEPPQGKSSLPVEAYFGATPKVFANRSL